VSLLAVCAIGADQPGIVAQVTGVLLAQGANLEDTSMTILRGHFAMTMVVEATGSAAALEAALQEVAGALDLVVTVRPIAAEPVTSIAHPYVVSVHGADHPGIVHRVASLLSDHGVNITDVTTRLVGADDPLYVMQLDVDVPAEVAVDELRAGLDAAAVELGVVASMHAADADLL
jgi:glycine cleavage system transcriptional repressor